MNGECFFIKCSLKMYFQLSVLKKEEHKLFWKILKYIDKVCCYSSTTSEW